MSTPPFKTIMLFPAQNGPNDHFKARKPESKAAEMNEWGKLDIERFFIER